MESKKPKTENRMTRLMSLRVPHYMVDAIKKEAAAQGCTATEVILACIEICLTDKYKPGKEDGRA